MAGDGGGGGIIYELGGAGAQDCRGTHFTCFTSTKVQILTGEELLQEMGQDGAEIVACAPQGYASRVLLKHKHRLVLQYALNHQLWQVLRPRS